MIVLVSGGRFYGNEAKVYAVLDLVHARKGITAIIHGDADGADSFGRNWAHSRRIPERGYPAEWGFGGYGGNARNARMLREEKVDLLVSFPGGPGTMDMRWRAEAAGIKILRVR